VVVVQTGAAAEIATREPRENRQQMEGLLFKGHSIEETEVVNMYGKIILKTA
jgi:hypothetical protein